MESIFGDIFKNRVSSNLRCPDCGELSRYDTILKIYLCDKCKRRENKILEAQHRNFPKGYWIWELIENGNERLCNRGK